LLLIFSIVSLFTFPDSTLNKYSFSGINNGNVLLIKNTFHLKNNSFGVKEIKINNSIQPHETFNREIIELDLREIVENDSFFVEVKCMFWNDSVFLNTSDFNYYADFDTFSFKSENIIYINCDSLISCANDTQNFVFKDTLFAVDCIDLAVNYVDTTVFLSSDTIPIVEPFLTNIRITNTFISFDKQNDSTTYHFIVEYFFNDNWIVFDELKQNDSIRTHLGLNVKHFPGKNKYRLRAYQMPDYTIKYISDVFEFENNIPPTYYHWNPTKKKLTFTAKTLHEIISKEADYFSIHFGEETDLKNTPKGIYYIYFENKFEKIYID
jgi:hypothetical protein